jgi:pimeloyl-ACP methyl ester esterase
MPCITIPTGVTLHYCESGTGRPIVFLHGWAMSGRAWHFQESLDDCGRLIFLDQRGHGHSSTGGSYLLKDYAADLVSLFERLELRDAVVVGWSMGVQVALEAFPALKSRLSGLVLVGGTPRFTTTEDFPYGQPPVEVKGMGVRLRRDYQKTMGEFFKGMFAEGEMDKAQYQRIVHEIVMSGKSPDPAAAAEALKILSVADQREQLPSIDRPVLLVHGELDAIVPATASEYMAQQMPLATLKIMHGCGHGPFMTRPEVFNRLIEEFVARL